MTLRGHRVGRLGEVTGTGIRDEEWNPLVPRSRGHPYGEMGRRILVRWDLTIGPEFFVGRVAADNWKNYLALMG